MVDESRQKPGESHPTPPDPLGGLTDPRFVSLERVHIRTRENLTTRSAWRLIATTAQGEGTISLIEISPTVSLFRGEGVFLGWSSDRLQSAYRTLLPRDTGSDMEFNQLG
ncbi:MAG: hypothetical protein LC796_08345 [Acidobacteria bacterium]|nr:hypothetical protein [Acidobacteriota bacterium]